jgi:hypothetical protein
MANRLAKLAPQAHHGFVRPEELMSSSALPHESLVLLWAGESAATHAALIERLQAAKIPFVDKRPGGDWLSSQVDVFRTESAPQFGFEVAVLMANLSAAEAVLEKLMNEEPVDLELPAEDSAGPGTAAPSPSKLSAATSAVWSGDDHSHADFLTQALRENEIPVRVEKRANAATVFVPPEEETLAREIIREIEEGQPPA